MTKSIKYGKVVYNFLDNSRDNIEIGTDKTELYIDFSEVLFAPVVFLTHENVKDLIKVLQEFSETGELK